MYMHSNGKHLMTTPLTLDNINSALLILLVGLTVTGSHLKHIPQIVIQNAGWRIIVLGKETHKMVRSWESASLPNYRLD